jgi:general secretion pathway protein M
MIDWLNNWIASLTARERMLLLVAASLALGLLAWLLVFRPLGAAGENARDRHADALTEQAQVIALVSAIEQAQAQPPARPNGSIRDILAVEAARVGFDVAQIERAGTDGVRLIIAAVRAQVFFSWVSDLEAQLGLHVEALTVRPNADETLAVEATFRSGRS